VFDGALRQLLEEAAEAGARRALAAVAEAEPSRLIPLRAAPVAYRTLLAAIAAGELRAYRVGKRSFLERREFEAWILAHPSPPRPPAPEEPDEVDRILAEQAAEPPRRRRGTSR